MCSSTRRSFWRRMSSAIGFALATMSHLGVFNRDTAFCCDALPNLNRPVFGHLKVLVMNLHNGINVWAKWLGNNLIQVSINPALQRGHLPLYDLNRHGLLLGIAPVDVQTRLDAGCEQQRDTCLAANVLGCTISQF